MNGTEIIDASKAACALAGVTRVRPAGYGNEHRAKPVVMTLAHDALHGGLRPSSERNSGRAGLRAGPVILGGGEVVDHVLRSLAEKVVLRSREQAAPLISHRVRNVGIGFGAATGAIRAGWFTMTARPRLVFVGAGPRGRQLVGRNQIRQANQLQPRVLEERLTEEVGMDELDVAATRKVDGGAMHHRVFNHPPRYLMRITKPAVERCGLFQRSPTSGIAPIFLLASDVEVLGAAVAQYRARRVHDSQQIPAIIQMIEHVAADMAVATIICRLDIARPCVMTAGLKGAADNARAFTGNEDAAHLLLAPHRNNPSSDQFRTRTGHKLLMARRAALDARKRVGEVFEELGSLKLDGVVVEDEGHAAPRRTCANAIISSASGVSPASSAWKKA